MKTEPTVPITGNIAAALGTVHLVRSICSDELSNVMCVKCHIRTGYKHTDLTLVLNCIELF